jgi:hypothetical protein
MVPRSPIVAIKPPKFRVKRFTLNEYELRNLMLQVAKGEHIYGIVVTDMEGNKATIQADGSLSQNLFGMDIMSRLTLNMLAARRENGTVPPKPIFIKQAGDSTNQ